MSEVSHINSMNESVTLEWKKLKNLISCWQITLFICFVWGISGILFTRASIIALQKVDPNTEYGHLYYSLLSGLWLGFATLGVLTKTILGRIIGIISSWIMLVVFPLGTILGVFGLIGLNGCKLLYGKNALDYKEIKRAYKKRENYTTKIENRKKNEELTKTANMAIGSFMCSVWVILGILLLYILMRLFPYPPPHNVQPFSGEEAFYLTIFIYGLLAFLLAVSLTLGVFALSRFYKDLGNKNDIIYAILGLIFAGAQLLAMLNFRGTDIIYKIIMSR